MRWSRRARRSSVSCRVGARLSANVGRTGETKNIESPGRTKKTHWVTPAIGVVCITSGSDSREWALSGGGALSGVTFGRRVNSRHEPSERPRVTVGPWGLSDQVGVRLARPGSLARRRVSGVSGNCRARSTARGCSTLAPSFVRARSVPRVVGLLSSTLPRSPA
jgi:hypothetical protein